MNTEVHNCNMSYKTAEANSWEDMEKFHNRFMELYAEKAENFPNLFRSLRSKPSDMIEKVFDLVEELDEQSRILECQKDHLQRHLDDAESQLEHIKNLTTDYLEN